ncbi:uncharacterized protein B0I36DRAFT_318112 [Microdochium trichocladiopsis]|uniref:Major facilitator superfamily transporter n=1 Tax=Microdochium trichocladiopsis TaxID=1682393 RepID=A0A9P9BTB7_9PEZI|nr:uncharacterized protein B0I36DRAFT_318112 [Microdochium trichocladiopsis]KAH7035327.1 hypothetical protein B0I36DRAFT_318112 [Microdochium trichocladiopsis]
MGVFQNPLAKRKGRGAGLPVYEKLNKDRLSDDDDSYDSSDYDSDDSSPSGPDTSRNVSASAASVTAPIMPRRPFASPRRPGFHFPYRLPSKVTRYLCLGLVSLISLFILSLVRASQNENRRIIEGLLPARPSAPPLWESYDFLTRYYGGVRNLVSLSANVPEYPRAQDELPLDKLLFLNSTGDLPAERRSIPGSKDFTQYPKSVFKAGTEQIHDCFLDSANKVRVPPIRYFDGRPNGFPDAVVGSYELLSLPEDICFERYGRYAPYGYGYSKKTGGLGIGEHGEKEGFESTWSKVPKVEWQDMNWAETQRRCYNANAARFKDMPAVHQDPHGFYIHEKPAAFPPKNILAETSSTKLDTSGPGARDTSSTPPESSQGAVQKQSRTAVVIRCWDEFLWREEDVMNLRSLITEMSLASGGRYDVHLLVQVKNDAKFPVWADAEIYKERIEASIPAEFRGMVTLWTETQMLALYQGIYDLYARGPDLPVHGVYRGLQMAMQYFAYKHPEYDYFWQWEMDIRYTGHYFDFFSKVENWSKQQPRKGLWERNGRFYLPTVHGSWEDFKQMARVQSEMGTTGADNIWSGLGENKQAKGRGEKPIWGPVRPFNEDDWFETDNDPQPETTYEKDRYSWGVGEEAEYIAFNPIYDPEGTTWGLADDITGYNTTEAKVPRRAQIITAARMSRRLLMTMHRETAFKKHHAFPEMWPATVALHHGLKAVFAPHPLYVDREWPTAVFGQTLNNGKNGASGGSRTSVFGEREHNLRGLSWFYDSGFAPNLYRRWLGLKVNNDGGEEFEQVEDQSRTGASVPEMRGGEGRMCLPPMLLHPIKNVELPVEADPAELEIPESDPNA